MSNKEKCSFRRGKIILIIFLISIIIPRSFAQVKIMPLGDSITEGDPGDTGYRRSLYLQLVNAGYNVDFVGSLAGGSPADFDLNHEGHGGWFAGPPSYPDDQLNDLTFHLNSFLTGNPPDVILLHIGTNDITEGLGSNWFKTATQIADIERNLCNTINTFNPAIVTFLARIVNRNETPYKIAKTDTLNGLLQQRADSLINLGRKIVVVDIESALTYPDDIETVDPFEHPLPSGYQKMANAWFSALQNHYQPPLAAPNTLPANGAVNQPVNLAITWNEPPAASSMTAVYDLQVATNPDFSAPHIVFEDSSISGNSYSFLPENGLEYGTTYYWRVRILHYGWSVPWSFTTMPPLFANIKVFLQGPYAGSSTMNTNLTSLPDFPHPQPYNTAPWSYAGGENVSSIPSGVVDWVLVELRETATGTTIARRAGFLKNDGSVIDTNGTSPVNFSGTLPGNYYIVIRHRNHLAVMSATAITPTLNTLSHDFTTSQSQAFGTNPMANFGDGKFGLIAGDANSNGEVTYNGAANDKNSILSEVGLSTPNNVVSGYSKNDTNMDSFVTYNGASNDKNKVLGVVGLSTPNNVIQTQLP